MATNGRKRYFHIDKNASSEQIYALLDDVESAVEFIAEEKIRQAASTQDTSLNTPEANLHLVTNRQSVKEDRKEQKRRIMEVDQKSKSYQARRVSPRARNTAQSKWNSFPNRIISFGDRPPRATRIDSWTIKPLCSSDWKNLQSYQGRTESISWNKLRYGNKNFIHNCWILESR